MNDFLSTIYENVNGSAGIITTKEIEQLGIGRHNIKPLVEDGFLIRESRGIYSVAKDMPDEYAVIQKRSSKLVFSYGTALFFHGLSDRVPGTIDVTLPQGYNAGRLKKNNPNLRIHYVKQEVSEIGVTSIKTPQGSMVRAYNKERCVCDLIKDKDKVDKQMYTQAIKEYFSGNYNVRELIKMAKIIGVEPEVRMYMEVL